MNIFQDKILYSSVRHACRELKLESLGLIRDAVGNKAALLKDKQGRKYYFTCKRYIFFRKEGPGIVSITREIVEHCAEKSYTLVMLIQEKDGENTPRNYLYTFNPRQILDCREGFDNLFNGQVMRNFPIWYAMNMEQTRRRELTSLYVKATEGKGQDAAKVTLTRFLG